MNQTMTKFARRIKKSRRPFRPHLRFTPTAWAKLLFMRDRGETEIGGFGLTETNDPLFVTDIELVDQLCTSVSVKFADQAVGDFFDRQVDRGLKPAQFARIWVHTHPGKCSDPSFTDEETFERVFGLTDWSVMFILACGGQTYARLQFSAGPGGALEIPVRVDFSMPFAASDESEWEAEYLAKVTADPMDCLSGAPLAIDGKHALQSDPHVVTATAQQTPHIDRYDPFYYGEEYWHDY
jgi:hypothetical protein